MRVGDRVTLKSGYRKELARAGLYRAETDDLEGIVVRRVTSVVWEVRFWYGNRMFHESRLRVQGEMK